jgi:putative Mn2+ efflux pump MntP
MTTTKLITKHSVGPVISFCVWSILIALCGVPASSAILAILSVIALFTMVNEDAREKVIKQHKEYKIVDHLVHLALVVWILSWTLAFPLAFLTYIISFTICTAMVWKARYDETTEPL